MYYIFNIFYHRTSDFNNGMNDNDLLCQLRLMSWNIHGSVNAAINDSYFKEVVNNNDIIILTETWLAEHIDIFSDDFYNYHNIRPMHARAKRPSGGISILMRHHLRNSNRGKGIQIVKEHDCFVWLKIDKLCLNMNKNIFICATYIPPKDSTYWDTRPNSDPYNMLEQDIAQYQQEGDILFLGDFNARTGTKEDYVSDLLQEETELFTRNNENSVLEKLKRKNRNNCDQKINVYGNKLLDLCKGFNMRILNGRTLGDSQGSFTCFQSNVRSTVDYAVASEYLMQAIPNLKISAPNHLSDHAHISCTLKSGHQTLRPSTVYQNHNNLTTKMLKKIQMGCQLGKQFSKCSRIAYHM